MHPKVKLYEAWVKELKLEFQIYNKKGGDWRKVTNEIEEFQKKVDVQVENVHFIAQNVNNIEYAPLLQKGLILMKQHSALSKNMSAFYNRFNEMQKIFLKMTTDITESSKNLDPAHPEILIRRNQAILKEAKVLMKPIEKDLNEWIEDLQDEREELENTLNGMTEQN